jgi:hypothetical protein
VRPYRPNEFRHAASCWIVSWWVMMIVGLALAPSSCLPSPSSAIAVTVWWWRWLPAEIEVEGEIAMTCDAPCVLQEEEDRRRRLLDDEIVVPARGRPRRRHPHPSRRRGFRCHSHHSQSRSRFRCHSRSYFAPRPCTRQRKPNPWKGAKWGERREEARRLRSRSRPPAGERIPWTLRPHHLRLRLRQT